MGSAAVQPCDCRCCAALAAVHTLDGPQLLLPGTMQGPSRSIAGVDSPLTDSDAPAVAPAGVNDKRRSLGSARGGRPSSRARGATSLAPEQIHD